MTYQVFARKYRPQLFAAVVGQDHVTITLQNALAARRVHNAYLFTGSRGVGKTTVARLLARALNCEQGPTREPCGVCAPCRDIAAGTSLDVQEIDGASNTSVDDVREIRERVKYLPASGRYKIYIIDEVHMLSTSAFNALLKTLEEPPPHVIFVFATTEAQRIPATILSRCQRFDFRRIPTSLITAALLEIAKTEQLTVEPEAARLIAHEASGSLRDAESLLDQAVAFAGNTVGVAAIRGMLGFLDRGLLFDLLRAVVAHDTQRSLAILDEVFAQGADLARFGQDVLDGLRHLVVLKECAHDQGLVDVPADEVTQLQTLAASTTGEELEQMFALWYAAAEQVARSPFPKMLFEVSLLRLCRAAPVRPIGELMARIEQLAAGTEEPTGLSARPLARGAGAPCSGDSRSDPTAETTIVLSPPLDQSWQEFQRWLVADQPRVASLLQHGELVSLEHSVVRMRFANPLYADMLTEPDRKAQVESLLAAFFKRPLAFIAEGSGEKATSSVTQRAERARQLTKEALGSSIVREAADILGAEVHDVKALEK